MGRFILIDHSLVDFSGHHYQYAEAVLSAAADAGYRPVLVANRRFQGDSSAAWPIIRAYKYGVWLHQGTAAWQVRVWRAIGALRPRARLRTTAEACDTLNGEPALRGRGPVRKHLESIRQRRFLGDTRTVLERLSVVEDDLIFVPTLSRRECEALERLCRTHRIASRPVWHLLFRRPPENETENTPSNATAPARGPTFAGLAGRWHYWTDSAELTAQYRLATGQRFETLPIPHAGHTRVRKTSSNRFRVLYLGGARSEKGFQHLPQLVRALTDDIHSQRFEFYFQAHKDAPFEDNELTAARAELAGLAPRGVTLFTDPLCPAAYRELLASGDVVVLPYDARSYAGRSSGVFAEALAAGIPLVAPEGTWMSRRLPSGAGLCYAAVEDAARCIREISANYLRFADAARHSSSAWRGEHDARRLVSLLRDRSTERAAERRFSRPSSNQSPPPPNRQGGLIHFLESNR